MPTKGKCAVIFGGAGFIGSHLLASLIERGFKEVISADIVDPVRKVDGVRYEKCDVRDYIPLDITESSPDEVYNLAAVHRTPGHLEREYLETNIPGAENVCKFCQEKGVERLVFTSSIAVYGPSEAIKDENSPMVPVSAYGESKLKAEKIHRAWAEENPTRCLAIVRPAVTFGPGESGNFTRLAGILKKGIFFYPGRRDTIKGCGYVGDLVESFEFALSLNKQVFLYNFCYPEAYTIEDICKAFHEVAGTPIPKLLLPLNIMLCGAYLFELLNKLGLKNGINRARINKLVFSTHIAPNALEAEGFIFSTDIKSSLQRWQAAEPAGIFL